LIALNKTIPTPHHSPPKPSQILTMIVKPLKIAILGAGSLGCVLGGVLTEAGHDVWLINRGLATVATLNTQGLTLRAQGIDRRIKVKAVTECSAVDVADAPLDLLIVLVKSFHTDTAMQAAVGLVGPHTTVLSLQNGVGHEAMIGRIVGADRVIAGKTYVGGHVIEPALVVDGSLGKETVIGEPSGGQSPRTERIAAAFTAAGLRTTVSANIQTTVWDKLLANAATGAVSAIAGLSYGPLYEQTLLADTAIAAVAEGMAVAKAAGIAITDSNPREPWLKAGAGLPRGFKTSMLQSLEKGSITEIDFINGAIVDLGKQLGVPTPVNATLVACVKAIESKLILSSTQSNA
jgi:2-dehydropantoate 2-reductase